MNFVIEKFLSILHRDYHIDFKHTNTRYTHTIFLYNLHPELERILMNLSFELINGVRPIKNSKGEFIKNDLITSEEMCVTSITDEDLGKCLLLVLNENDYGNKISKVDYAIKRFLESHSPIDVINGRRS